MKNLIFIGGGGFFNELYEYIEKDIKEETLKDIYLKGVLSDKICNNSLPIKYLGTVRNYSIQKDDIFIIAIGNPIARSTIYKNLVERGAVFFSYIHQSCYISPSAKMGKGIIIAPNTIINANVSIEDNVVLNVFNSIGHDSSIGKHTVLSPFCAVSGESKVGTECFFGTRATVFPGVTVENKASVDAHACVKVTLKEQHVLFVKNQYKTIKNRLI